MNTHAKYLLKLLKDAAMNSALDTILVIKNFMIDSDKHKVWDKDDLQPGKCYKKCAIIGVKGRRPFCNLYINDSSSDSAICRSMPIEWNWSKWGEFSLSFDDIRDGTLTEFLESALTQLLLASERGKNVFLGHSMMVKKNSAYKHLMNIDLIDAIE